MSTVESLLPGLPLIESPLFEPLVAEIGLTPAEQDVARDLRDRGFAVIDFPDPEINERIARICKQLSLRFAVDFDDPAAVKNIGDMRVQDAWLFNEDVRAIAANEAVSDLLSRLYGRRAFPFQTLNFPVGTQQHMHSDAVHFSSQPERFMCGVWLAMEDVDEDNGPVFYFPGSHKWPITTNGLIGQPPLSSPSTSAQAPYEAAWRAMVAANHMQPEMFLARKGQALIWVANLLHGGCLQNDLARTRWSQVTHYYFEDCIYYTPAFSDEVLGQLAVRKIHNIATGAEMPNQHRGAPMEHPVSARGGLGSRLSSLTQAALNLFRQVPADFEPEQYLALNPDVGQSSLSPAAHYIRHGMSERRRYR